MTVESMETEDVQKEDNKEDNSEGSSSDDEDDDVDDECETWLKLILEEHFFCVGYLHKLVFVIFWRWKKYI